MQRAAYLLLLSTLMFANGAQLSGHHARVAAKLQEAKTALKSHPSFKLQADAECTAKTVTCAALGAACDDGGMETGASAVTLCDPKTGTCMADGGPSVDTMSCQAWIQPGAACQVDDDCDAVQPDLTDFMSSNIEWICYESKCTDKSTIAIPAGCRTLGDMCAADADCVTGLVCSGGVCDGPKTAGQVCNPTEFATACAMGLVCYTAGVGDMVCTKQLSIGSPVTGMQMMLCPIPGVVVDGKCAVSEQQLYNVAAGGACDADSQCRAGLYCDGTVCAAEPNLAAVGSLCNSSAQDPCGTANNDMNELQCVCDKAGGSTKCQNLLAPCYDSFINSMNAGYLDAATSCGGFNMLPRVTNGIPTTCVMSEAYLNANLDTDSAWTGACKNQPMSCAAAAGQQCFAEQYLKVFTQLMPSTICGVKMPTSVTIACSPAAGVFPAVSIVAALGALLALIR